MKLMLLQVSAINLFIYTWCIKVYIYNYLTKKKNKKNKLCHLIYYVYKQWLSIIFNSLTIINLNVMIFVLLSIWLGITIRYMYNYWFILFLILNNNDKITTSVFLFMFVNILIGIFCIFWLMLLSTKKLMILL